LGTPRRRIDTVLFDVGNTLLDFDSLDPCPYLAEGFRLGHEYLASLGHALPPLSRYVRRLRWTITWRFVRSRLVRREMRLFETMIDEHHALGISLDRDTAAELAWRMCLPMRRVGRADPDARAVLSELRARRYKLGIISNTSTPPPALDRHLAEEGLLDFFPIRVYSCAVGYMKPDRRIFEIALARLGSAAANTVYVGDKLRLDVRGAGRLGMVTVLKAPAGQRGGGGPRPDHVVHALREVPGILEAYGCPCPPD
jgi:HAD superfamily hydrolase (TIGR01549 family)